MAAHLKSRYHRIDPANGAEVETFDWHEHEPPIEDEDGQIAYIRHLENQGWAEAEDHRRWEENRGVVQFDDALARSLGYIDAEHRREEEE